MRKGTKVDRISQKPSKYGVKIIGDIPSELADRNMDFGLDGQG
jgi:hypothetical protein